MCTAALDRQTAESPADQRQFASPGVEPSPTQEKRAHDQRWSLAVPNSPRLSPTHPPPRSARTHAPTPRVLLLCLQTNRPRPRHPLLPPLPCSLFSPFRLCCRPSLPPSLALLSFLAARRRC